MLQVTSLFEDKIREMVKSRMRTCTTVAVHISTDQETCFRHIQEDVSPWTLLQSVIKLRQLEGIRRKKYQVFFLVAIVQLSSKPKSCLFSANEQYQLGRWDFLFAVLRVLRYNLT